MRTPEPPTLTATHDGDGDQTRPPWQATCPTCATPPEGWLQTVVRSGDRPSLCAHCQIREVIVAVEFHRRNANRPGNDCPAVFRDDQTETSIPGPDRQRPRGTGQPVVRQCALRLGVRCDPSNERGCIGSPKPEHRQLERVTRRWPSTEPSGEAATLAFHRRWCSSTPRATNSSPATATWTPSANSTPTSSPSKPGLTCTNTSPRPSRASPRPPATQPPSHPADAHQFALLSAICHRFTEQ